MIKFRVDQFLGTKYTLATPLMIFMQILHMKSSLLFKVIPPSLNQVISGGTGGLEEQHH